MARIVFEIQINADPKSVVEALDAQAGIAAWWSEDVSFAGGVGSTMTIAFPDRAPMPFELRVDEVTPDTVKWSSVGPFPPHWVGTHVTWTLTAAEQGTVVHFSHAGWASDEGPFAGSALTWGALMFSLKAYVETGTGQPLYRKP